MPTEISVNGDGGESMLDNIPDSILFHIFSFLPDAKAILRAAQVCKRWHRVAQDEFLWKDIFYWYWKIDPSIPKDREKGSWQQEYKRLFYHSPLVESEVLKSHRDQVLHVSFSHKGDMFATCSKDGFIKVWTSEYPASIKFMADLRKFNWKYTQFSQFNESDTLLLVSGVHFGSHSTSGEIAVFSLTGSFELQCRVINKPYDIFGTWYNDSYLLSGQLSWLGHLSSASVLWLNKAHQEAETERTSVVMRLFKFRNVNASSVRTIMIANIPQQSEACLNESEMEMDPLPGYESDLEGYIEPAYTQCTNIKTDELSKQRAASKGQQKIQMLPDNVNGILLLEVDSDSSREEDSIEYSSHYRWVERGGGEPPDKKAHLASDVSIEELPTSSSSEFSQSLGDVANANSNISTSFSAVHSCREHQTSAENADVKRRPCPTSLSDSYIDTLGKVVERESHIPKTSSCQSKLALPTSPVNRMTAGSSALDNVEEKLVAASPDAFCDKYLIFTTGKKTYTPHQIGIKRIKSLEAARLADLQTAETLSSSDEEGNENAAHRQEFDNVDHLIELDGHIIGMCLSPDHRYLYVNSRPWPKDYNVVDPLYPPPIAQEIDIHVIDLHTKQEVGTMLRAHKAYTPNDECFFIFLDVCNEYVASGAEDRHGYLWDRHYGVLLTKFPHTDVVNSVAFNPKDSEMLVTVSDDNTIKIWRSRNRELQLKGKLPDTLYSIEAVQEREDPCLESQQAAAEAMDC